MFPLLVTRSASSSKRTRRSSKTSVLNDRNNEFIFDDEHLIELLKRLKQQPGHTAIPMTSEDETALVETLISKSCLLLLDTAYLGCLPLQSSTRRQPI